MIVGAPPTAPPGVRCVRTFADWVASGEFPETPHYVSWIGGASTELSGRDPVLHESPRAELNAVIVARSNRLAVGRVTAGGTFCMTDAGVMHAPDVSLLSPESLAIGRASRRYSALGSLCAYEGPPDLAVEVVAPTTVERDSVRLFDAYYAGGVTEYWLVDCLGADPAFTIFTRGDSRFEAAAVVDGHQHSPLLRASYRLRRVEGPDGDPDFRLDERPDA